LYKKTTSERIFDLVVYTGLTVVSFTTLYPFIYLAAISLNDTVDAIRGGIYFWPRKFTLENYWFVLKDPLIYRAALNSVLRVVIHTAAGVFISGMLAFVLSRKEFIFRKSFNFFLVMTMYVNAGLIPMYLLFKSLGLFNTFLVYIVPGLVAAFNVFLMRSYFENLPDGLVESARIDGAGDFMVYTRIILPISLPVLATIALLMSVSSWNEWFSNYLYNSRNQDLYVLQYVLQMMIQSANINANIPQAGMHDLANRISPNTIRATLAMVVTLPIILAYPLLQRYFVKGMTLGAMKE
jgi:putative aldouronate transport system permease protein